VNSVIENRKPSIIAYPPTDRFGDAISESEVRERARSGELRILFLGNVIYRKGLHTLLKAISGQRLTIKVDVVGGMTGEPKYAEEMQRFVMANGLESAVTFHNAKDNVALVELFKRSHLMVVPSSYEGFGIVYIEGMGFGLPAIGTTAGAASEVITHGSDGYLIEPDDAQTLAGHLAELDSNRELLRRLSLNAVRRYQSQPRWEETARSIREFLSGIASDHRERSNPQHDEETLAPDASAGVVSRRSQ
jgi:glycosyltransferase involved in cell wall biosynthesis